MTAKRKSGRGASRPAESATSGGAMLRWYSLGLVSGLFLALVIYLATLPAGDSEPVDSTPTVARRSPVKIEFPEILQEPRIKLEIEPADLPQRRDGAASRLLLQAGSFRQAADADRRRAELLLLGLEPSIEESQGESGRWYRVLLGPFESSSDLARARSLTAQQDIDTLTVRRDAG